MISILSTLEEGMEFNPDELGRIERMEQERRQLARNDRAVFDAATEALKREKQKLSEETSPFAELKQKQEAARRAREEKNKK